MNTALIKQLREYLSELMLLNASDPARFAQLQAHDKVINEYVLEAQTGMNLFDWIRDFKDLEIRQALQKELTSLQDMLAVRDNEIIELLLKLEDFELKFFECDEANF